MHQHAIIYFSLFLPILVIYLSTLYEVNCAEDELEFWKREDANHQSETSTNTEEINSLKPQGGRSTRPRLDKNRGKILLDMLISQIGNNTKNKSIDWSNTEIKRLDVDPRDRHRNKRHYKNSESSESETDTDTEIEFEKNNGKEIDKDKKKVKILKQVGTVININTEKVTTQELKPSKKKTKLVMNNVEKRESTMNDYETGNKTEGEIAMWQGDTEKTAQKDMILETKIETGKVALKDMGKTTTKDTKMETQGLKETNTEKLKSKEIIRDSKSLTVTDKDVRKKNHKYHSKDKDKKHLVTTRHKYDRNRDRWRDDKKRAKERQRQKEKEKLRNQFDKSKKEETVNYTDKETVVKLATRHKDTTTDSYTSNEKEMKQVARHTTEYTEPRFTAAHRERPELLKQAVENPKSNTAERSKNDEPSMHFLSPYSIAKQLQNILCELQHTNVTLTTIGRTAAYNDIILLQATEVCHSSQRTQNEQSKYADDTPEKKIIFIVHGLNIWGFNKVRYLYKIHEFVLLLKNYLEHLDKFDIYLIPMANPDGVAYSNHHSVWNKNMSPQDACPGVMLDRNFDVAWTEGPQLSSCSQQFAGSHAFSEYETQAIREVFHRMSHKIVAYIHVHGGGFNPHVFKGDAVLFPKGYSELSGDDDKYVDLKGEIDEAMRNASFKVMSVTVDSLYNWYGKVTGTSVDYASTVYGIPIALEFVMQLYAVENSLEDYYNAAQNEIWHRIIDVIFKHIHATIIKKETSDLRKKNKMNEIPI